MRKLILTCLLISITLITSGFTVVGHRGDPLTYPEETFQSIDHAVAVGANYVELDVHESADGVLVVQHDNTIQRMTGAALTISATPYATLHAYHTKNGEPVHSLQEVLTHYRTSRVKFLIETKVIKGDPDPDVEAKLAAMITRNQLTKRVMFHSFSLSSLKRLQRLLPQVPRLFIVGSLKRITFAVFPYVSGINVSSDLMTPEMVSALHAMGQKVYVWDEMNEDRAKWRWLVNLNIDGVVTNYPALAREFQQLKRDTASRTVDQLATNTTTTTLPVYANPYTHDPTRTTLAAGASFTVQEQVTTTDGTYYRMSQNRFVPATGLTLAPNAGWAVQLLGQRVWAHGRGLRLALHPAARTSSGVCGWLTTNSPCTIDAVRLRGRQVWVHVGPGWVRLHDLLLAGDRLPRPLNAAALPETPQVELRLAPGSDLLRLL
ncbi:glycerophosphodiester phosphodiesterase [Lacticaseibacillus absianus]|uniref:glycerophosphodiester phosphodiesterase n=1 Tax=Lacticaseibacillus absianus TaxID=2729623 RepID=UPI0015C74C32|nr:glycerophosphodiester phosphodiesterase [Lacticaseibacillus absianus]